MSVGVRILALAEAPHLIPTLRRWLVTEWPAYYGPSGPGDAGADLQARAQRAALPVGVVALDEEGAPLGTAALTATSIRSHAHLTPWLSGLLVEPTARRRGIGARLVEAIEAEAVARGFERLYAATDTAGGILARRGWVVVDEAASDRRALAVFARAPSSR